MTTCYIVLQIIANDHFIGDTLYCQPERRKINKEEPLIQASFN